MKSQNVISNRHVTNFERERRRIEDAYTDWPSRYGSLCAIGFCTAVDADVASRKLEKIRRDPQALVEHYFSHYQGIEGIRDLLSAINDYVLDLRFDGHVLCDLSETIAAIEDFLFGYNQVREREE